MRVLFLLVATSVAISAAEAQPDPRPDSRACADSATTGLYRRCALWIDGRKVRRGEEGQTVSQPGFFRPQRLTGIVAGDSALFYAHKFERRESQSMAFWLAGGVTMGISLAIINYRKDQEGTALAFVLGGAGFTLAGIPFQLSARRAAARAVWWNNERFAR